MVIVGAGTVGSQLAQHLVQEKHDVSIIEADETTARHASNRLDCLVIHDAGNSIKALEDAGVARADALVCVTNSDEINIIICGIVESKYPRVNTIARVRNDDYIALNRAGEAVAGVNHFVHPDVEVSRTILDAIEHGVRGDILSFAGTPFELGSIEIPPGSPLDGLSMKDYRSLDTGESLVTLVERKGESILPTGATTLLQGDRLHVLAREEELDRIFKLSGLTEEPLKKIGIVGGGRVSSLLVEGLMNRQNPSGPEQKQKPSLLSFLKKLIPHHSFRVVIIERDYQRCKELSARYPEALVLNEDISDESFIAEERIDDLDLIITATERQEVNIITAVYLKSRGVKRAIAMVTGSGYASIARKLGVDVVVPNKTVVVDSILSRLAGGGVTGIHRLGDGSVKILETEVAPESTAEGQELRHCELPPGNLVMLAERQGTSFIPRGDYVFQAGDHLVIISKSTNEGDIGRVFAGAGRDPLNRETAETKKAAG